MHVRIVILTGVAVIVAAVCWFFLFGAGLRKFENPAEERPVKVQKTVDMATAAIDSRPASEPARVEIGDRPVAIEEAAPVKNEPPKPATATIEVYVVDKANGLPLQGARVGLWEPEGGDPESATSWSVSDSGSGASTNASGVTRLEVPAGIAQRLHVKRAEDKGADVDKDVPKLNPGDTRQVKIEMPAAVETVFVCRVVRESDSAPVAGAKVHLTREVYSSQNDGPMYLPPPFLETRTDGDGYFRVAAPSWEPTFGRIDAEGQGSILFQMLPGHATHESACVLAMPAAARLHVNVVRGGAPAAAVNVRATVKSYLISRPREKGVSLIVDPEWTVTTNVAGAGVLAGLPPGVGLTLEVLQDGKLLRHVPEPVVLAAEESRSMSIRIGDGVKILGRAVDQDDKPIAAEEVWLVSTSRETSLPIELFRYFETYEEENAIGKATTNANGEFTLDDVAAGDWLIGIAPVGDRRTTAREAAISANASRLTVTTGGGDVKYVLRATRGLYIRGRVLKPDGTPAPGFNVSAHMDRGGLINVKVDGQGRFTLGPLVMGQHIVRASGFRKFANSLPVTVDAGAQNVKLRLRSGGSMRGRVVNETGEPCQADIKLYRSSDRLVWNSGPRMFMRTTASGEIEFDGIEPGLYDLMASTSDGPLGIQRDVNVVDSSETAGLVMTLRRSGTLVVKIRDFKGVVQYFVRSEGVLVGYGEAAPGGEAARIPVPPGPAILTYAVGTSAVKTREVKVTTGQDEEVLLDGKD